MTVKQISVFIENRKGRLEEFSRVLAIGNIDLSALSIADTTNFGILRAIVSDQTKALELLRAHGYTASLTDVLAVAVPDTPGGLSRVLTVLREKDISIEYLYTFVHRVQDKAVLILRADSLSAAEAALKEAGVTLLSETDIQ